MMLKEVGIPDERTISWTTNWSCTDNQR